LSNGLTDLVALRRAFPYQGEMRRLSIIDGFRCSGRGMAAYGTQLPSTMSAQMSAIGA